MIQRVQSLYMLLWPLVVLLVVALFPMWTFETMVYTVELPELFLVVCVSGGLSLFNTFLFHKRKIQLIINRINMVIIALIFPALLLMMAGWGNTELVFGNAAYLPLPGIILLLLANRGIKKDEKLIRSMDRLR